MAISGLLLILFLIVHLAGNLALLIPDGGKAFNLYSKKLHEFGTLLNVIRVGLLIVFVAHIISGIRVFVGNMRARKQRYAVYASKRGPSKLSPFSKSMIISGIVLAIFVPLHVNMFTLGTYYTTVIDGEEVRDLYRLVIERFNEPLVAFGYAAVMLFLGMHLRHGIWSAFQSLGALSARWSPVVYGIGIIFSILLAVGFIVLPVYVYFFVPTV